MIAGTLVAISLSAGLVQLASARRGRSYPGTAGAPIWLLWLGLTFVLVVGFCILEGLEAAFEPRHVGALLGIFGEGGVWVLPAAALVGAVMTLLACGGRALLGFAARGRLVRRICAVSSRHPRALAARFGRRPMASGAAGRAPPVSDFV